MSIKSSWLYIMFALCFYGCSSTKNLDDGQFLVVKNNIIYTGKEHIQKDKEVSSELLELVNLKPYQLTKNKKENGVKKFWYKNIVNAPFLYDKKQIEISRLKMEKYLLDRGYIGSHVKVSSTARNKKMKIEYHVNAAPVHTIGKFNMISDSTEVGRILRSLTKYVILKEGDDYSKKKIDEARARYSKELRNRGYINITNDYFYFTVDTHFVAATVDITAHFKVTKGKDLLKRYKLGKTYIQSKAKSNELNNTNKDTLFIKEGMYSTQTNEVLKPSVIDITVDQDMGDYISLEKQELTVNHFLAYGIFKYVNQKYSAPYGDSLDILDRYITLTHDSDASIGADFEVNNRSGSFLGAAVSGNFTHKNLLRGAEVFKIGLSIGAEAQFLENQSLLNSVLAELNTTLDIPRLLLLPFLKHNPSTFYIPRTNLQFKNSIQNRIDSYSAIKSTFSFGYNFRETKKSNHRIALLSLSYLNVFAKSQAFEAIQLNDRRLSLSLQNIFDIGIDYTYTFSNQNPKKVKAYAYFSGTAKVSGNTLSALVRGENSQGQKTIFGTAFSQYAKVQVDYRYYLPLRKSLLVSRIKSGIAYAYGNSDEVPYNEQFIVGGSQSLRGFRIRGLGPGAFVVSVDPDNPVTNQFYDQTGDIILEMNLEYRFPIIGFVNGATFLDAGNIWLLNESTSQPRGKFSPNNFLNQIAINTGFGLRLDLAIVILRLDLAMTLRRPYLNEGFQWTLSRPNRFDTAWRQDNLRLQLGIGYPF